MTEIILSELLNQFTLRLEQAIGKVESKINENTRPVRVRRWNVCAGIVLKEPTESDDADRWHWHEYFEDIPEVEEIRSIILEIDALSEEIRGVRPQHTA